MPHILPLVLRTNIAENDWAQGRERVIGYGVTSMQLLGKQRASLHKLQVVVLSEAVFIVRAVFAGDANVVRGDDGERAEQIAAFYAKHIEEEQAALI